MNEPIPPSKHDLTVFRGENADEPKENWDKSALYFQIEEGRKFIGDSGYAGEPSKVVVSKNEHSPEFREFQAQAKNCQETLHWRIESFNILGQRFRHGNNTAHRMHLHKMAVELVAGIVQYDYETVHPHFDIC